MKNINKNNLNIKRSKASTWTYVFWLTFGGFFTLSLIFMMGGVLTISLFGVNMATQAFRLASYLLNGDEKELEPSFESNKVKNTIWLILGGWLLYIFHYIMGGIFYITYVGRGVAKYWFDSAKLVAFPFDLDLTPKGADD